jgi:hypothetical protein
MGLDTKTYWLTDRQSQCDFDFDSRVSRVEAGSNNSTLALRVVGGNDKGPSACGYNRATLFLGDINTGTWPSRLGESRIWDSKIWSWVPWDSDLRMTSLARTSINCKRQRGCYIRTTTQVFSLKIKLLVVSLKGLVAKTKWFAVNLQS